VTATALPDHRKEYLEYEGPVSGNRGSVKRVDQGKFELIEESEGDWVVHLCGDVNQCTLRLKRASGDAWTLTVSEVSK